jgi:hypothetical protein
LDADVVTEEAPVVEGEVVPDEPEPTEEAHEQSKELARQEQPAAETTLFGTSDPAEVIERAAKVATVLKDILVKQRLTTRIGTNDHVMVEGWGTVGSMVGVFAAKDGEVREIPWPDVVPPRLKKQRDDGLAFGYTASYKAQTLSGAVVGGGEADCKRTETKWATKGDHALKSMAQTRAQSKALKVPLSFIVAMAGYEPTPAEEMDMVDFGTSGYGGQYGPEMHQGDLEKLARALTFLVKDAQTAMYLKGVIEKESGGYFPRIVSRSIIHAARAARDGIPEEEKSHDGNADAG